MKPLTKGTVVFDSINNFLSTISGVFTILLTLAVVIEVIARYFFNYNIRGVLEAGGYCLVFISFMLAAWVLKNDGHMRMDLLVLRLRPKTQATLNLIISVFSILVCLVITYYGINVVWEHFETGHRLQSTLRPPSFPLLAIVPLGAFLFAIQFCIKAYGLLDEVRRIDK